MLSLATITWQVMTLSSKGGGSDGGNNATKLGMDSKHNFNNWDNLPDKGALRCASQNPYVSVSFWRRVVV